MKKLTNKHYWDDNWDKLPYNHKKILFKDIFENFLTRSKNKKCIEIGCVPGRFLIYLHKQFNYSISGIDFSDIQRVKQLFKKNNIKKYKLYKKDFCSFRTKEKFDLVCSFGFIEHFKNYKNIFKKHISLVKKNGLVIIELPNFNSIQYFLHKFLDKPNLKRHNIEIMDLNVLKKLCNKNKLQILHLNYYKTADFWIDKTDKHNFLTKFLAILISITFKSISLLVNIPNKFFSPYIILIAKKK
jgi:cyclopropane fatty-acyl-phospholipid synthase-like methyltransferase